MKKKDIIKAIPRIVILILIFFFLKTGYQYYIAVSGYSEISNALPESYKSLFLEKYRNKFTNVSTHESKVHTPTAMFDVNGVYEVVVFKLLLSNDAPSKLSNIVRVKFEKSNNHNGYVYEGLNQTNFQLLKGTEKQQQISKIFLKFNGINLKTVVSNDSLICFSGNFNDFSLQYSLNGICDIYAEKGKAEAFKSDKAVPINLLFYREKNAVYFIILGIMNPNTVLKDDVLYSLVVEK